MIMTTELAQRMKFEAWAEEASALPWGYLKKRRNPSGGGYSVQVFTYMWTAWQAASAELVEALEAALMRNAELEARTVKLPGTGGFESTAEQSLKDWADGWKAYREEAIRVLTAAGVAVEGE